MQHFPLCMIKNFKIRAPHLKLNVSKENIILGCLKIKLRSKKENKLMLNHFHFLKL